MGLVFTSIETEIQTLPDAARTGWRAELARSLARQLDEEPNASMARELRALMKEITADLPATAEGDVSDDLAAKRRARIASAAGS